MGEAAAVVRFACEGCGKVIKAREEWAGRAAKCPFCQRPFTVPAGKVQKGAVSSRVVKQLGELVAEEGEEHAAEVPEQEMERAALLLAQGTCREYGMAKELLAGRKMLARQWRRVLNLAGAQEQLRERVEAAAGAEEQEEAAADATPIALLVAADPAGENAWTIGARYLYFLSHGICAGCKKDVTGMSCMYLTFGRMLAEREVTADRWQGWRETLRQRIGV